MLNQEDNELITNTERGTPMGELFRRFWMPVALSEELPGPDCIPVKLQDPERGPDRLPRHRRPRRPGRRVLPAPRRAAVLRPQRGGRPALRLPRLEVRRRRQVHRHAEHARGRHVPRTRSRSTATPAARPVAWSSPTWARRTGSRPSRSSTTGTCRRRTPTSPSSVSSATGCRRPRATSTPATASSCTRPWTTTPATPHSASSTA